MRQSTAALLFVLACTLLASWFLSTHDKVTREEFVGFQGEARINDFLAAEMLLTEFELAADSLSSLTPSDWLPEQYDTLVMRASPAIAVGEEADWLTSWVAHGGRLVLLPARQDSRLTAGFLEYLGFRFIEIDLDDPTDTDDESPDDTEPESFDYVLDVEDEVLRIEATEEGSFSTALSDERGIVAARLAWGDGYVTVVAVPHLFSNYSIDRFNHGRLLLDIVTGYVDPGVTWFVYDLSFPSLWEVIWGAVPYCVVGLAIAIAFWLWSKSPRFGPAAAPESITRRSIIEHIRAAGHFAWRHRGAGKLSAISTAALLHEAETRHPGIGRLSAEQQAQQLARITGLPVQRIMEVLVGQGEPRQRDFTHNMQALQGIRKEL